MRITKKKTKQIDPSNWPIVQFARVIKKNTAEFTQFDMMEFMKWMAKPKKYIAPVSKVLNKVEIIGNTVRLTW